MSYNWKKPVRDLVIAILVWIVLAPFAYGLSISPTWLLLIIIALVGLWTTRKRLPAILKRAKAMVIVVCGTTLFLGFLIWYLNRDIFPALALIVVAFFFVTLSFGFYPDRVRENEYDETQAAQLKNSDNLSQLIKKQALPIEEQKDCPKCRAVIPLDAKQCSWCKATLNGKNDS